MSKVYAIISGKGGTGKTTTAVNLGAAMNRFKEEVVIVDANVSTPNLGLHFGAPIVPVSLSHVLQGKADIDEAIYEHESGIKIVPSSLSLKDIKKLRLDSMSNATRDLRKLSNHIILDSAAGLGEEAKAAISAADEVIIVTNPNILSVTDSLKAIKIAQEMDKQVIGFILTRVKNERSEMPLANIQEMLEVPLIGIVPEDSSVSEALVQKNAVIHTRPRSKASRAYTDVAARILGKRKMPESLFQRILSSMGLR